MVRPIVRDPMFLSLKSEPASKEDIPAAQDLLDTLKANADRCVGLAANMIGVRKTILAARIGNDFVVMINPRIVSKSERTFEVQEGCLSLEGTRPAVRHSEITVEYSDIRFRRRKRSFSGFEAQIIQHETDHFSGILI